MAEKIEGVYEIKIVQGPALKAFEDIKKRLDDTKGAIRDMNKDTRNLVAQEQAINKAIKDTGQATAEQNAALAKNKAQRESLNKTLSEAVLTERRCRPRLVNCPITFRASPKTAFASATRWPMPPRWP